jgi:hypothetical protein
MSGMRDQLQRVDLMRHVTCAGHGRYKCGLRGYLNQDRPVPQSRGVVTTRVTAQVEVHGGRFGSFRPRNHRGRLARATAPVGLFQVDATPLLQQATLKKFGTKSTPRRHGDGCPRPIFAIIRLPTREPAFDLRWGVDRSNPDNKISRTARSGLEGAMKREMTCDATDRMLGFPKKANSASSRRR